MADDSSSSGANNQAELAGQAAAAMLQENSSDVRRTIHEDVEDTSTNFDPDKQRQIELEEEKKLKARHPCIQRPGSEFLQKRLQRGQKYFDSGDYNMAKASTNSSSAKLPDNATPVTAIDSKILNKRH